MKKLLFLSIFTSSLLFGVELSEGNTVQENRINCDDGSAGFEVTISNDSISQKIYYNSCNSFNGKSYNGGLLLLSDSGDSSQGQTVNINGTDYFFPNGYTTPTTEANDSCTGGYDNGGTALCYNGSASVDGKLDEGWLNAVDLNRLSLSSSYQITNIDNLSNLKNVDTYMSLSGFRDLEDFSALSNLESVGNTLNLSQNQHITDVNFLSNLKTVGGNITLNSPDGVNPLYEMGLNDLSGLNNLESIGGNLLVNDKDYEVKLDSDSYLCQNAHKIRVGTWQSSTQIDKSKVCN